MNSNRLLIRNATILTVNDQNQVINSGFLFIEHNLISEIGSMDEPIFSSLSHSLPASEQFDASGMVIMPGLINGHTHAAMTIFRGLADDLPLKSWLEDHIWPAEAAFINETNVEIGTKLAVAEMLLSGTVSFANMYFFEEITAKICKSAGIRVLLGEALLDFPTPSCQTNTETFNRTESLLTRYKNDSLIRVSVALHSPYACSPELLSKANRFALEHNIPVQIHLSETENEEREIQAKYGLSATGLIEKAGLLRPNVVTSHVIHPDEYDLDRLISSNVGIVHNPRSNMKLASGFANTEYITDNSSLFSLGTDSAASNNTLDLFKEMNASALVSKLISNNPMAMNAKKIVRSATIGGALTLGVGQYTGSLEKGKWADLIFIDFNAPHLTPCFDYYSHLVYAVNSTDVKHVMINGSFIVVDRKILGLDQTECIEKANQLSKNLAHLAQH
ncbi:MAG: amidohydrolase [Sphingobacteriia bacterium]|nr:amidohydrolase [Sphingobacteriia bacterium]